MRPAVLILGLFVCGSANAGTPTQALRNELVANARALLGAKSLRPYSAELPDDCTGFVRYVYESAGIELEGDGTDHDNGVTSLWRAARSRGALKKSSPLPGDLVFFRETYDRNRDGLRNDGLTHIGLVTEVLPDGTVVFAHRSSRGIVEGRFNLAHRKERFSRQGRVLNDYLRSKSAGLRAFLTGELWAGAASARALR